MDNKCDLMFPQRFIPSLLDQRGEAWQSLVEEIQDCKPTDAQKIAFVLMIVKLSGCATCNVDALRALRGCAICARLSVTRYKGSDQNLIAEYILAHQEVESYLGATLDGTFLE